MVEPAVAPDDVHDGFGLNFALRPLGAVVKIEMKQGLRGLMNERLGDICLVLPVVYSTNGFVSGRFSCSQKAILDVLPILKLRDCLGFTNLVDGFVDHFFGDGDYTGGYKKLKTFDPVGSNIFTNL